MDINLLDLAKKALSSELLDKASLFLEEDSGAVSKGFDAAIPSILGAIVNKNANTGGAGHLLGLLKEGRFDGKMLDNLGEVFGGGAATSGVLDSGGGLLKMLLGNKIGGVADIISKVSNIGSGSSNKILSIVAPIVMSLIGRTVKNKALDAIGLGKLLGNQKSTLANVLPTGIGSVLGLGDWANPVEKVAVVKEVTPAVVTATQVTTTPPQQPTEHHQQTESSSGLGILKYIIPLALISLIAYFGIRQAGCGSAESAMDDVTAVAEEGLDKAGETAQSIGDAVGDMATSVKDMVDEVALKTMNGINFVTGSVGDQFSKYLAAGSDTEESFKFNNLQFGSGSGEIQGSSSEIANLAAVLKAYPNVHIKINGYTDSQGNDDTNQALSEYRANTVMRKLQANGINASRMMSVGHGETNPIGDNNTAQGRAMNRRIEIEITSR